MTVASPSTALAGSITFRSIATRALRRIRMVGIVESPASELMDHALDVFNDMLSGWERGLETKTITIIGNTQNGERTITDLDNSTNLYNARDIAPGMNISGTGIAASTTVFSVDSKDEITLDTAATASGTGVSLTFTAVPFDASLTEAMVSVLAVRLAEDFGQSVGPILARDARRGQAEIDGAYLYIPTTDQVDRALVEVPSSRFYDGSDDIVNG